jgi:HD-GYP domain-containing protein (c-di-GMP phosphodiesterase class II)
MGMGIEEPFDLHTVVEAIITILDARDPYTFEHSWRVGALSEAIVEKMGIASRWRSITHIAAHLHDIGKVGVPDAVLNKPGRLTDCEFELMRAHSQIGFEIVSKLPPLDEIALYVRHHHERWDGKGYPCGLSGRDIPLGARIIAVADTFDAITTRRSYRAARSLGVALAEIEQVAAKQLCPEVSAVLIGMRSALPAMMAQVEREIAERKGKGVPLQVTTPGADPE